MLRLFVVYRIPALMAKAYYDRLSALMAGIAPNLSVKEDLEIKHFSSGAAMYADGRICISLTPAGFGLKLPGDLREELVQEEGLQPLRYFPKAPIKKEYVVLPERMVEDKEALFSCGYYQLTGALAELSGRVFDWSALSIGGSGGSGRVGFFWGLPG